MKKKISAAERAFYSEMGKRSAKARRKKILAAAKRQKVEAGN
jgi:hypothetical protein